MRPSSFHTSILTAILLLWTGLAVTAGADSVEDGINTWRQWKDIHKAIELRTLDDPADIIEKAEIIEDRVDELSREKNRLQLDRQTGTQKLRALEAERELLKDLAEVRHGGDFQTSQHLQELAERIQREEHLQKVREDSLEGLGKEIDELRKLAAQYRERAENLRNKERRTP